MFEQIALGPIMPKVAERDDEHDEHAVIIDPYDRHPIFAFDAMRMRVIPLKFGRHWLESIPHQPF